MNSVEQNSVVLLLVFEPLKFISNVGGGGVCLQDRIQFTETSLYDPMMSDALGVNLCNCELCNRLLIIVGGSYIVFAV